MARLVGSYQNEILADVVISGESVTSCATV
jgi:hypothetical protein